MVRPFAIKGKKRKRKEEKYDREEQEEVEEEESAERVSTEKLTKEAKDNDEKDDETGADELVGIPIAPSDTRPNTGVIFVLEKASLEVAKVGKSYQLLNSDDHANFLRKNNKNPADYRPDIVHQALLAILDSPVNKAGRLQAVYVRTEKGVLFEVKPHVRIPRTYKRFSGIMLQLLQKLNITAVGFSYSSEKFVKMRKYVDAVGDDMNLVFVVGAMAHGKIETEYTDDFIAISGYPLSAAMCIARITEALADKWNIL
ncbi:hypothetical protein DITRI_Ditri19aG0040900 [Diplodiscus trichospermus]